MSKKKQKDEEKREKSIFGSGAEPLTEPKDDGLVKCVCTVPCAWRGYHDEGDRVFVERKLLESDPFFKGHFKPLEPLAGHETGDIRGGEGGSTGWINDGDKNANVSQEHENNGDPGNGASVNNENADGGDESADGGDGQGELGLK